MADRTSGRGAEGPNQARDGPSRHGPPIVVLAAGLIVLALGLAVAIGWYAGSTLLVQLSPTLPPMRFSTALGLATCGAGLLALVRGSHRLAVVAGGAVTALGAATLAEYLWQVDLGIDRWPAAPFTTVGTPFPGRMSVNTALAFVATGAALATVGTPGRDGRWLFLAGPLTGSVLALAFGTLLGTVLGIETDVAQGPFRGMAVHTAAGFALLGAGLAALLWRRPERRWLPASAGAALLVITLLNWQGLAAAQRAQLDARTQLALGQVTNQVASELRAMVAAFVRMGRREEARSEIDRREWERDATLYTVHYPSMRAVEWADPTFRRRWIVPLDGNQAAQDLLLGLEERRLAALDAAQSNREASLSHPHATVQGVKGMLIVMPVRGTPPRGYLMAVVDVRALFEAVLENVAPGYLVTVFHGGEEVYTRGNGASMGSKEPALESELETYGVSWRVRVSPGPTVLARLGGPLPQVTLTLGTALSLILAFALAQTQSARQHAREVEEVNRDLEHEVGERTRIEGTLRQSEEKYRELVDELNDGIFVTDQAGVITFANRALAEIHGLDNPAALLGHTFLEFVEPNSVELVAERLRAALEEGKGEETLIVRVKRGDGRIGEVEVRVSLVVRGGHVSGTRGVLRDVADRIRLEQQMRQAQKMEAVGRLAGGVAHDFNNLLTVVLGECELALAELPNAPPELSAGLEEVKRAATRGGELTRQLLTFSRRQVVEPSVIDLNHLALEMEKMLRRLIGEDVQLVTHVAPDLAPVKADRGQVEQVLANLAVNARDAMPQGGKLSLVTANVTLDESYARSHAEVAPGEYVSLAVSDTGIGMSEDVKAHLFEPFFTTKGPGKGTGLGLATCYGIVRQAGGHIAVYSEVGVGTTMRVYLPAVREQVTAQPAKRESRVAPGGTEAVLVAEDEEGVRKVAVRILRHRGYTVLEAANGAEATRLLQERDHPVDLLLTDIVMPDVGGWELSQQARTMQPTIKVLFMSGYSDEIVLNRLVDAHAPLLAKPFTSDSLLGKVREVLDS